ncbi:hypothetical protein [Actinomadura sediminis]|uniref:LamG domain-containing protein n=1 Tax=Actinomadura sediminis TaxID=1038904 RepID=A0ABW3EXW7_9ACTN
MGVLPNSAGFGNGVFRMHLRAVGVLASGVLAVSALAAPASADEMPARYAGWSMDDAAGPVARAVEGTGVANPDADLRFTPGVRFGEPGNLGIGTDRAVRLNGRHQFGQVRPLVDTSERFMFATWVKLASLDGDQVAVSQAAADGGVFELGWIGSRWTFRHRAADGGVVASVKRDMAVAADGSPWTEHWVSLMGGYDPDTGEIWLRTQADGSYDVCVPGEPWNCHSAPLMPEEIAVAPTGWTASPGDGPLLFGVTSSGGARHSYWNGWLDDSQLWPLTYTDRSILRAVYGDTVGTAP